MDDSNIAFTEESWWDEYGEINENIWHYNAYLNAIVRDEYLQELSDFLFKIDGRLLDFGCGGGWVSIPLAQKGMYVEGIDLSEEQIARAQDKVRQLQLTNANYTCGDVDLALKKGPFDSIVVHSVLHHLQDDEKRRLLATLNRSLITGGRVYLYEPMAIRPDRPWYGALFDKGMIAFFRFLRYIALVAHWYLPEVEALERANWIMISPDESPILYQDMLNFIPEDLKLVRSTYWQAYSVKYANFCMSLKAPWRNRMEKLVPIFYKLDRLVLRSSLRDSIKVWPMASFLLEKQ